MRKTIMPDESFAVGPITVERFGEVIRMTNCMDEVQRKELLNHLANKYDDLKEEIDYEIMVIQNKISECDPLKLLLFASDMFRLNLLGIDSEFQIGGDKYGIGKFCEYVQSVLVSTQISYKHNDIDQSVLYFEILSLFLKIQTKLDDFYLVWAAKNVNDNGEKIDEEIEELVFYNVRGNRYAYFERSYHQYLLEYHDAEFRKQFGISANEIIDGFSKLQYSISQGKMDPFNELRDIIEVAGTNGQGKEVHNNEKKMNECLTKAFTANNNDVKKVTGWPDSFIDGLTYKIGEKESVFNYCDEFDKWPIIELPVRKKPFIKIDNVSYCFDYYSLVDGFYRATQRMVISNNAKYKWNEVQEKGSLAGIEKIFSKLLPGCIVHMNNYYPISDSLKQMAENDMIIEYEDALFIIEVKSGSFAYTSPLYDYKAHVRSYKELIEKADHQCNRTARYIESNEKALFYKIDKKLDFLIDKSNYNYFYQLSITVDNVNVVASKAEKMSFLNLKSRAISISMDDLMVYCDYFESPWFFMHYLKQREAATQIETLALYDELDHLGLYINYNCYTYRMENLFADSKYNYVGYREEIDRYYNYLYHEVKTEKPMQDIPKSFLDLIGIIGESKEDNKVWLTSYLLDFSSELKEDFCQRIDMIQKRQEKEKRVLPLYFSGDEKAVHLTCFVKQKEIKMMSEKEINDYIYGTMIWNGEQERVRLDFNYEMSYITEVKGRVYKMSDIAQSEYDRLKKVGENNAKNRVNLYKNKHGNKIGRNEKCPCGSGKKYKFCCGRN